MECVQCMDVHGSSRMQGNVEEGEKGTWRRPERRHGKVEKGEKRTWRRPAEDAREGGGGGEENLEET